MTLGSVKVEYGSRLKELNRKRAENDLLNRQISSFEQRIMELAEGLMLAKDAQTFLVELADGRRGSMKGKIESVITEAMRLIYGPSYRAELSYSNKNNRSNLEVEMVRDTPLGEVRRDINGFGGGMADTMSTPLRLMVLVGSKKTDRVCVLDECWKHIDVARIEKVGQFLRVLSDRLKMQILFCTHHLQLQSVASQVYQISEVDGKSKVDILI
jgi:ABC-type dipeptide/oligopeptide/nickel transport system ATPase component